MLSTQFSSAIKKYEEKREKVYEELKIAYVQEKVKNKLLKQKNNSIDILFFDKTLSINEPVHDFVSESNDETVDLNGESSSGFSEIVKNPRISPVNSNKLSEYLDLEAEYSCEEEEDEPDDDLLEIIDNNVDNEIDLDRFVEERDKRNRDILSKLETRFVKKNRHQDKKIKTFETLNSDSKESFPEFEDTVYEDKVKENISIANNFENTTFKKIEFEDSVLFNNQDSAIQKLLKKDETKSKGFFERI